MDYEGTLPPLASRLASWLPWLPQVPLRLVLNLCFGQPLHVAGIIAATLAQRNDVVHLALMTSRWFGVRLLELGGRFRVPFDLASAIAWATLALDRAAAAAEGTAVAAR
jgi:hypothetical protein